MRIGVYYIKNNSINIVKISNAVLPEQSGCGQLDFPQHLRRNTYFEG